MKQFLNLSDAQLDQLRALLTERDKATQEARSQVTVKQRELNELLESGSTDAAARPSCDPANMEPAQQQ